LLPYNPVLMQNPEYAAGFNSLVAECQAREVAVQTIKSIASRLWREDEEKTRAPWYKPFEDQAKIDMLVHWVLSRPGIFLNSVGDVDVLPKVLEAASRFEDSMQQADFESAIAETVFEPIFT
jgi:hypothetical protein